MSQGTGMGRSFEGLPATERARRYREMADATFLKATRTENAELRAEYISLATGWHAMAQEIERASEANSQPDDSQADVTGFSQGER